MWLMFITDNPSIDYMNDSSMGIANVSANWTEIGDANKGKDLYNAGLLMEAQ